MLNQQLPNTMKAAQGSDYGEPNDVISVEDGVKVPRLEDEKKQKGKMLVKTFAVSLAPGDCRVLSGLTRELQGPPSFPYIPGGDLCGIVVELPEEAEVPFTLGSRVAVRFDDGPRGALGEYAIVGSTVADVVPESLSSEGAAALASASPAVCLADRIQKGERVLVLGAGGGVGSHLVQLLKTTREASLVVGVSRNEQRLLEPPLNCDKAIDYTKDDVFDMTEFQQEPFDVVVDLASGSWPRIVDNAKAGHPPIVKPWNQGGRYITTCPDQPTYEIHSVWRALSVFLFPALWRAAFSRSWPWRRRLPGYTFGMSLPGSRDIITRTMQLAADGKLQPVLHNDQPFPFTTEGVRAAFNTQKGRHPQGKVVVHVADE